MDRNELNRMFDGLNPSLEREQELLNELLQDNVRRKKTMKNWKRMAVGLAAAMLLVGTATAAHYIGVSIVDSREEDGAIQFVGGVAYYGMDWLSDEVKALEAGKERVMKTFPSWEMMEEFIGMDLMNSPLLDVSPATSFFESWTVEQKTTQGRFILDVYPGLTNLVAHGCYEIGDANIVVDSHLLTDKHEKHEGLDEFIYGLGFAEGTEVGWESCTTPGGRQAQVLVAMFPDKRTNDGLYVGAVSLNGVPTLVRVYFEENPEETREILMQVLDSFQ